MEKKWTAVIEPQNKLLDLKLNEVWNYRDLIWLNVQRDFKTRYKQTILGPFWFVVQPLLTTLIQAFVFGTIAGIPTDEVPQFLFYMIGNVTWQYFSACFVGTSNTFTGNVGVFGKIYFPRLTTPISTVITAFFNSLIQFVMFFGFELGYMLSGANVHITWVAALTPLIFIQLAALGLGCGIIFSSLTTKYRDLQVLIGFGVSLWMYLSPVIYSVTTMSETVSTTLSVIMMFNPVTPALELMRYGWLGAGTQPFGYWGISWIVSVVILFIGMIIFNKVEKTFMDTV